MSRDFSFVTSTASIAIFDPLVLKHRKGHQADWWTDWTQELDELNAGNLIVVGLGGDGKYEVVFDEATRGNMHQVSALIACRSGNVFIGPGEDITGGGLEPVSRRTSGQMVAANCGTLRVTLAKAGNRLSLSLLRVESEAMNSFDGQLLLENAH